MILIENLVFGATIIDWFGHIWSFGLGCGMLMMDKFVISCKEYYVFKNFFCDNHWFG